MDEGWTRWVLEQYGFSYSLIHPEDFKAPLGGKIDVLIVADDVRHAGGVGGGRRPRSVARRTRGAARCVPSMQISSPRPTSSNYEQFIRGGGTLVCLSNASTFAIQQLRLPVRNVVAGMRPEEFFLRGSIVEVTTDPTHRVMAGMPEKAAVFSTAAPYSRRRMASRGRCSRGIRPPDRRCCQDISSATGTSTARRRRSTCRWATVTSC